MLVKEVLKLLQLLCENCNNNLQNYLSYQTQDNQKDDLTCINIVKETADLLASMIYNFSIQKNTFTKTHIEVDQLAAFDPEVGILFNIDNNNQLLIEFNLILNQCFDTLTDFCVGPCNNNQKLLCDDLKLVEYINENILKKKHLFELEELDNEVN